MRSNQSLYTIGSPCYLTIINPTAQWLRVISVREGLGASSILMNMKNTDHGGLDLLRFWPALARLSRSSWRWKIWVMEVFICADLPGFGLNLAQLGCSSWMYRVDLAFSKDEGMVNSSPCYLTIINPTAQWLRAISVGERAGSVKYINEYEKYGSQRSWFSRVWPALAWLGRFSWIYTLPYQQHSIVFEVINPIAQWLGSISVRESMGRRGLDLPVFSQLWPGLIVTHECIDWIWI